MEEEAVPCNALSSQGVLLAVLLALCTPQDLHPTWPHKACRLGHKIKQGYVTYQIPVSCVGHKHLRVPVTAS